MIVICLLALVALLFLGSIAAFFLCFPVLPIALVAVILLGMALLFLLGFWAGATRVLRDTAEKDVWLPAESGGRLGPSFSDGVLTQRTRNLLIRTRSVR